MGRKQVWKIIKREVGRGKGAAEQINDENGGRKQMCKEKESGKEEIDCEREEGKEREINYNRL